MSELYSFSSLLMINSRNGFWAKPEFSKRSYKRSMEQGSMFLSPAIALHVEFRSATESGQLTVKLGTNSDEEWEDVDSDHDDAAGDSEEVVVNAEVLSSVCHVRFWKRCSLGRKGHGTVHEFSRTCKKNVGRHNTREVDRKANRNSVTNVR